MTKLLQLALLCSCLFILSAGNEEQKEQNSLKQIAVENEIQRTIRGVDKKNKQKNKDKKNKNRSAKRQKKNKSKKRKQNRNKKKRLNKNKEKKRSSKSKDRRTKKKKSKKAKRRKNKSKKNRNKGENKNGQKKEKRKRKENKIGRQSGCSVDVNCVTLSVKYLKQVKDKVSNFEAQRKRIAKFISVSDKKGNKSDAFDSIMSYIVRAGGGDASDIMCENDMAETEGIKELNSGLMTCKNDIENACDRSDIEIDDAAISDCKTKMDALSDAVNECLKIKEGEGRCECWTSDSLAEASMAIGDCKLKTLSNDIAAFKKSCVSTFASCRKLEDKAAEFLFKCPPPTTKDPNSTTKDPNSTTKDPNTTDGETVETTANELPALLAKARTTNLNRIELNALKAAADALAGSRFVKRQALTCSAFTTGVDEVSKLAKSSPADSSIATRAKDLIANKPSSCSGADLEALKAIISELQEAINTVAAALAEIQDDIKTLTGSTASPDQIGTEDPGKSTTPDGGSSSKGSTTPSSSDNSSTKMTTADELKSSTDGGTTE